MKFTKEDAYKELVAKMTARGEKLNLSERSINGQLETLMPLLANEETELNAFIDQVLPIFQTADANVRNDVSVGIKKYKEENPVNPTTPPVPPTTPPANPNANDELLKRLEAMEKELAENRTKQSLANVRASLLAKIKEKGVTDESWINDFVSEVNITEDMDVEAKSEHYVQLFNKMNARVKANVTPSQTGGGSEDKGLKEAIKQAAEFAKAQNLYG